MFHKRWLTVFIALTLLLLLVPACGGGGEENTPAPTPTPIATTATTSAVTLGPTQTPEVTSTPTPAGSVKIGIICAWSGPMAMSGLALVDPTTKLVEQQVKDMGGILGGRGVEFVKYDSRANVAEAQAGARKLLYQDKVSALAIGGLTGAEVAAVMDFAEENKIFFASIIESLIAKLSDYKFTVNATAATSEIICAEADIAIKVVKPKTVAILRDDTASMLDFAQTCKKLLEAAGINIVYEDRVPLDTVDFLPYLTKIKYEKPDVLMLNISPNQAMLTIAKQIVDLGGWSGIKVIAHPSAESAIRLPGADGWYVTAAWLPGLPQPGAAKFEKDYQAMYGKLPTGNHVYFYNSLWTAIYAIELAGTDADLVKIAQVARSGNLEWDTPMGRAHFTSDGDSGLHYIVGHVEEGKLVPFTLPE